MPLDKIRSNLEKVGAATLTTLSLGETFLHLPEITKNAGHLAQTEMGQAALQTAMKFGEVFLRANGNGLGDVLSGHVTGEAALAVISTYFAAKTAGKIVGPMIRGVERWVNQPDLTPYERNSKARQENYNLASQLRRKP